MAEQRHNPRECWCGIDHGRERRTIAFCATADEANALADVVRLGQDVAHTVAQEIAAKHGQGLAARWLLDVGRVTNALAAGVADTFDCDDETKLLIATSTSFYDQYEAAFRDRYGEPS